VFVTTTTLVETDVTKTTTQTVLQTKTVTTTTTVTLPTCTNKAITVTGHTGGSYDSPPKTVTVTFNVKCFVSVSPNTGCTQSWSSEQTVNACASNCASNAGCNAWSFQLSNHQCTLYYNLNGYTLVSNNGYVSGLLAS